MNFAAAKAAADEIAKDFVISGQQKCPLKGTGLLVLPYREDDKEVLPDAKVAVGKTEATADASGIARYLPLAPDNYTLSVVSLPDPDRVLVKPEPKQVDVKQHTCPVEPIEVAVYGRPSVKLTWKHDNKAVSGAGVTLDGGKYDLGKTGGDGVAAWDKPDPIKPASYSCAVTLEGGAVCQLFTPDSDAKLDDPKVTVPKGKNTTVFRVRQPSWVKLRVVEGGKPAEDASVELVWPDDGSKKTFKTAKADKDVIADVKDIAAVEGKFTLSGVELSGPEAYEFEDVTSE